jgi:hypothetical protein
MRKPWCRCTHLLGQGVALGGVVGGRRRAVGGMGPVGAITVGTSSPRTMRAVVDGHRFSGVAVGAVVEAASPLG